MRARPTIARLEAPARRAAERHYHSESTALPANMGAIVRLTHDKKTKETESQYRERSGRGVRDLIKQSERHNQLTLFVCGTVMSPDARVRDRTITLFSQSSLPRLLPKEVMDSLSPGHVALYRKDSFVSHLLKKYRSKEEALDDDINRTIKYNHHTTIYLVQINADFVKGLDERIENPLLKKYSLKPTEEADNCASAIAKILTPYEKLFLSNINPIAAVGQVLKSLAKASLDEPSYDKMLAVLHESGLSRSLAAVADDEAQARATTSLSASHENEPAAKTAVGKEADSAAEEKDAPADNNPKGM
jgi:hypothetical protein